MDRLLSSLQNILDRMTCNYIPNETVGDNAKKIDVEYAPIFSEPKAKSTFKKVDDSKSGMHKRNLKNHELQLFLSKKRLLRDFKDGYLSCDTCYGAITERNLALVIDGEFPRFLCTNPECNLSYMKKKKPASRLSKRRFGKKRRIR